MRAKKTPVLMQGDFEDAFEGVRTPWTHPYSYDPFDNFNSGEQHTGGFYTDRLLGWDFKKHDQLCLKHFGDRGQVWSSREPAKVEAFCREWTGDDRLKLVLIRQYCNHSNGYPTWFLGWVTK